MSAQRKTSQAANGGGTLLPMFLAALVMVSAIAVVQIKHKYRTLTTQLETLRAERERLELEWAQLQLEEATLAQHGRVDSLARLQFGMIEPLDYRIVEAGPGTGSGASRPQP